MPNNPTADAFKPAHPLADSASSALFLAFPHNRETAVLRVTEHNGFLYSICQTAVYLSAGFVYRFLPGPLFLPQSGLV